MSFTYKLQVAVHTETSTVITGKWMGINEKGYNYDFDKVVSLGSCAVFFILVCAVVFLKVCLLFTSETHEIRTIRRLVAMAALYCDGN